MREDHGDAVADQIKDHARSVAEDTREKIESRLKDKAESARDGVADEMRKHASAADAAAGEFDPNSVQAQAIEQIAARIDDLADQVRSTDIDRLAQSVGDAARRNPLLFVAGATLAGFAATRFLKARDPHPRESVRHEDPWSDETADQTGPTIVRGNHPEIATGAREGI